MRWQRVIFLIRYSVNFVAFCTLAPMQRRSAPTLFERSQQSDRPVGDEEAA